MLQLILFGVQILKIFNIIHKKSFFCDHMSIVQGMKRLNTQFITDPSPSFSKTSLNSTADPMEMLEEKVNTVWKAIVSEMKTFAISNF